MFEKLKKYTQKEVDNFTHSFWGFFAGNIRVTIVVIAIIIVWGSNSYRLLPQETTPEIKVPIGVVTTVYPGANAKDIEELITNEIETEINALEELEKFTSVSQEGISSITVEFDADADLEDSYRELRDAVDNAKPSLPDEADDPMVTEIDFENQSIVTFSLFGDYTYEELEFFADTVQEELEKFTGIREVKIFGDRALEIQINVDPVKLEGYNLSLDDISQAIQGSHLNFPLGGIVVDNLNYQARFEGEYENAEEIKKLPIANKEGTIIFLEDVAEVKETLSIETVFNRLSLEGENPKQTISLAVFKKAGANIIQTVDEAKEIIKEIRGKKIPTEEEGLNIAVTNDRSDFIREDFDSLSRSAMQTIVLIFIVLFFALGLREAFIAGMAIPLTFLITFSVLYATDNSLNNVTLFGLVLGLGLLVDTSIVIMEGIHESIYVKRLSTIEAVMDTIDTYKLPLISGTATTISAFVPMYLMSGITGQFFSYIPTTITAVLLSSLLISLLISPAIARYLMKFQDPHEECCGIKKFGKWLTRKKKAFISWLNDKYQGVLNYFISTNLRRWLCICITLIGFISALALPILGILKTSGFPLADTNYFFINIEAPEGTKIEKTNEAVKIVEEKLLADPLIENFVTSVGGGFANTDMLSSRSDSSKSHQANITVNLVDKDSRIIDRKKVKSYEIADKYKEMFEEITIAKVSIPEIRGGPPTGAPIEVRIYGDDSKKSEAIAHDIEKILAELGGDEIENSIRLGTGDFVVYPDKELMYHYGLTPFMVASNLRTAVYGKEVADILRNGEEIEIWLKYDWGEQEKPLNVSEIENINILTPIGVVIPLKKVAEVKLESALLKIDHRDGDMITTVTSETGKRLTSEIVIDLKDRLDNYKLPDGYRIDIGGESEDVDQSYEDLANAMIVAIILIAFILILQFNSFKQPFIILLTLPMSLIGVFWGIMLIGLTLDIASFIGIVALAGIVVNDAIVLIDRINSNRRKSNMGLKEAVLEAGPARLQPIIITSITTVFGILPLALSDEFWLGLGSAIMFGISFSTLLTLILVPVLYILFENRGEKKRLARIAKELASKEHSDR